MILCKSGIYSLWNKITTIAIYRYSQFFERNSLTEEYNDSPISKYPQPSKSLCKCHMLQWRYFWLKHLKAHIKTPENINLIDVNVYLYISKIISTQVRLYFFIFYIFFYLFFNEEDPNLKLFYLLLGCWKLKLNLILL